MTTLPVLAAPVCTWRGAHDVWWSKLHMRDAALR